MTAKPTEPLQIHGRSPIKPSPAPQQLHCMEHVQDLVNFIVPSFLPSKVKNFQRRAEPTEILRSIRGLNSYLDYFGGVPYYMTNYGILYPQKTLF